MRTVCCVCQKVKRGGVWVKQPVATEGRLSHGFCPDCYEETLVRIHMSFAGKDPAKGRAQK